MLTTKVQLFAKKCLNTENFTIDLTILWIPIAKCCFLTIFSVQFEYEKIMKIWKAKMAAASDVIYMVVLDMKTNRGFSRDVIAVTAAILVY